MIILFVPIGTSALSNPDIGRGPQEALDNSALRAQVVHYQADPNKDPIRFSPLRKKLYDAHFLFWDQAYEYLRDPRLQYQTSAELRSTWLFTRLHSIHPDHIVLLPSDTKDSKFCAELHRDLFPKPYPNITISIEPIRELEANLSIRPSRIQAIFDKHKRGQQDHAYLNITGGLKGTIPLLTIAALNKGIELFYQHESTGEPVTLYLHG